MSQIKWRQVVIMHHNKTTVSTPRILIIWTITHTHIFYDYLLPPQGTGYWLKEPPSYGAASTPESKIFQMFEESSLGK